MLRKSANIVLLLIIFSVLTLSCSHQLGYGVILWGSKELPEIKTGDLVNVISESHLNNTLEVELIKGNKRGEVAKWRVAFFNSKQEAQSFLKEYTPYINTYARIEKHRLPIREKPDSEAKMIYRLSLNQVVKVISLATENGKAGNLTGNWYRILTDDGTTGFCFDKELLIFDNSTVRGGQTEEKPDQELENLLNRVWRPAYYQRMISSGTIDLEKFTPNIGLFPYPQENRIEIVAMDQFINFKYQEITRSSHATFIFEGSSLTIKITAPDEIEAQYTYEGKLYREKYLFIQDNIQQLIDDETKRRDDLYKEFLEKGKVFHSQAYGTIHLDDNHGFLWQNFSRLVPHIIPRGAALRGKIDFPVFLDPSLKLKYNGVISFLFITPTLPKGEFVNFLYYFTETGITLLYVPEDDIHDSVIRKQPISPLILYFSVLNEE